MLHRYIQGGYYIVMDVNSGAIHLMDALGYDMAGLLSAPLTEKCPQDLLDRFSGDYSEQEIIETYTELFALFQAGELLSEDDYEKYESLTALSPVKAMCLHIAHDCNMRCEYCFASTGDYQGGRKLMSAEVGKKAIDYLLHHSQGRRNLELDFFGGEPLMNFNVVKEIVDYARSKEKEYNKIFRFTITTNGLLLTNDKIDFINREMSNVVLSLDGRPNVNDRVRKRVDGSSCYDTIVPKFQKMVAARGDKPYYIRGTFTKYNLDFAQDVVYLSELGFDQISVEPVVAEDHMPYAITARDLPTIYAEYDKLAEEIIKRENGERKWFNFFHFMIDLEQGPCAIKRLRGCGCGNEYVAVTPDGEVYPCHQFVGHEEWKMGSVFAGTIDTKMKERFAHATVYGKEDCRSCWAKFYCSGGCNANGMIYNGDILKPHKMSCETEKKRIECALYIKAATL
ncbi:MAG TPA: thioether cross-link-forming SCIFF peptide maturase [Clostridia bacterium]|nr:thioether cross-link-forming SCIFF peptide maturase [Clostridia bacterium]